MITEKQCRKRETTEQQEISREMKGKRMRESRGQVGAAELERHSETMQNF